MKDELKLECCCKNPNKKCGYLSFITYKDKNGSIAALCCMPKKYNAITLDKQSLWSLKQFIDELLCNKKSSTC